MSVEIVEILKHYSKRGEVESFKNYGNGHINDTYLISYKKDKIILQCINKSIFKEPKKLMENIAAVTLFLRDRIIESGGDPGRETLNVVRTDEDKLYVETEEGNVWRAYEFLEDTVCYEQIGNSEEFCEAGYAFGNFQNLLDDFPVERLHEIIPDFHNTEVRFKAFEKAVEEDALKRAANIKSEIEFFISREKYTHIFNNALKNREIRLKVTHNDTKLNNVLFDKKSKKALCVIDLDTVMPGLSVFDFGDAIRFGANTGLEDERDLTKVSLDLDLFEAFTRGFLRACGKSLNNREIELLPMGAILMTYECGMRFLGDYIAGDKYFKISRESQNLDRARTQIKMVSDMEKKLEKMNGIVKKYGRLYR